MKTRWIGILGGTLIGLALIALIALPYIVPTTPMSAMMNHTLMDPAMMGNRAMMHTSDMMGNQAMMHAGGMTGGMMAWNSVIMASFWIGVLLLLTWIGLKLLASQTTPTQSTANSPDSLNILQQRFARGELNREEFEQMRGVLNQ